MSENIMEAEFRRMQELQIDRIVEVTRRAAVWLANNPDKHLTGEMALTKNRHTTIPTRSSADCFCFLGRAAKEAGIDADKLYFGDRKPTRSELAYHLSEVEELLMEKLKEFFEPLDLTTSWLWTMNDCGQGTPAARVGYIAAVVERHAKQRKGLIP